MANRIVLNPVSYHGAGAVKEIGGELQRRGFKRAFIASGRHVVKSGEIKKITDVLDEIGVTYTFFTDIKPNPSIENVQNGVKAFQEFGADCIIAVGGGSVMDTSKAIGIIINNPEFADVRSGYITKGHCEISDMFHLEAIRLIAKNLRSAVENDPEGRNGMALGQYIAGMGFSNVGLGIVHSMAHGLSALYDTPHGVACAILLPLGLEYNAPVSGRRYRAIGKAMEVPYIDSMNDEEAAKATIAAVKKLGADVGIPADLKEIVKDEDVQFLAESAFADACRPGNPRDTSVEEIAALYRSLM